MRMESVSILPSASSANGQTLNAASAMISFISIRKACATNAISRPFPEASMSRVPSYFNYYNRKVDEHNYDYLWSRCYF
jgi:hypothetical protein